MFCTFGLVMKRSSTVLGTDFPGINQPLIRIPPAYKTFTIRVQMWYSPSMFTTILIIWCQKSQDHLGNGMLKIAMHSFPKTNGPVPALYISLFWIKKNLWTRFMSMAHCSARIPGVVEDSKLGKTRKQWKIAQVWNNDFLLCRKYCLDAVYWNLAECL